MRLAEFFSFENSFRPLKVYEVVIFYFAVSTFWHQIFSSWLSLLPNMAYFEYPATSATTIFLVKLLDPQEIAAPEGVLGTPVSRSSILEIIFVSIVLIFTGIGAWALLVFVEAKFIGPNWTYRFWNLIDVNTFVSITWSRSWLAADIISVALVGPINEEIVFRGFILKKFICKYSVSNSILMSSAIFSIFHFNHSFVGSFFHSVIFSIIAIRLSSVYASIIVHGIYNFSVTVLRSAIGISLVAEKSRIDSAAYWLPEFYLLILGLFLGFSYIYFYIVNKNSRISRAKQVSI